MQIFILRNKTLNIKAKNVGRGILRAAISLIKYTRAGLLKVLICKQVKLNGIFKYQYISRKSQRLENFLSSEI